MAKVFLIKVYYFPNVTIISGPKLGSRFLDKITINGEIIKSVELDVTEIQNVIKESLNPYIVYRDIENHFNSALLTELAPGNGWDGKDMDLFHHRIENMDHFNPFKYRKLETKLEGLKVKFCSLDRLSDLLIDSKVLVDNNIFNKGEYIFPMYDGWDIDKILNTINSYWVDNMKLHIERENKALDRLKTKCGDYVGIKAKDGRSFL